MSQEIRKLLQGLGGAEDCSALVITYFGHEVVMAARRARSPRLLRDLDEAIERLMRASGGPSARLNFHFAPIPGWQRRRIAYTAQNRNSRLAWLRQGLRSGVFNGAPRGLVAVMVRPGGHQLIVRGEASGILPGLVAARVALRVLTSRSNRGQLIGPYWHRAQGVGVGALLPKPDQPSSLVELFADEGAAPTKPSSDIAASHAVEVEGTDK